MTTTLEQPAAPMLMSDPAPAERDLWLPPRRMRRYQIAKILTGLLIVAIFCGWLYLQWWQDPTARIAIGGLVVLTAFITARSIIGDVRRARGRQLSLTTSSGAAELIVLTPQGQSRFALADIDHGRWRCETVSEFGLWLYDRQGGVLAHLDEGFVADETEARMLLGWMRQRAELTFTVRWPSAGGL